MHESRSRLLGPPEVEVVIPGLAIHKDVALHVVAVLAVRQHVEQAAITPHAHVATTTSRDTPSGGQKMAPSEAIVLKYSTACSAWQ
jgi:hypothetical protein